MTVTIAPSVEPGRHWIWLHDEQGASVSQPFVVGALPEVREREPNGDVQSAQKLTLPVVVNGRLEKAGDVDCYAASLKKGQTLVAAFEGWSLLRAPMDAVLQIVSADGFVLEENNDFHGLDPFIAFRAPKDGSYIVRTFAFPAVPDTTIRFSGGDSHVYRLTLTTGGYADYPWPLAVERNKTGTVELFGWNIPDAARRVAVKPAGDQESAVIGHPDVANTVRVQVGPYPCRIKPPTEEPLVLDPPVAVTSRLARSKAVDRYVLRAKKGQKLNIRVESQSLGLPVTAVIRVGDVSGKIIGPAAPADLHGDTELAFSPPADGDYQLTVGDLYAAGGPRFAYCLRIAPPEPDFAVSVAADRFAVAAGKTVDVPLTVQRLNGLTSDIEFTAEGLLPGVEAKAESGKDPAKKRLKLTAKADATGGGPFRIVGRAKTGPAIMHAVTVLLPPPFDGAPAARMEQFWLTITRPAGK